MCTKSTREHWPSPEFPVTGLTIWAVVVGVFGHPDFPHKPPGQKDPRPLSPPPLRRKASWCTATLGPVLTGQLPSAKSTAQSASWMCSEACTKILSSANSICFLFLSLSPPLCRAPVLEGPDLHASVGQPLAPSSAAFVTECLKKLCCWGFPIPSLSVENNRLIIIFFFFRQDLLKLTSSLRPTKESCFCKEKKKCPGLRAEKPEAYKERLNRNRRHSSRCQVMAVVLGTYSSTRGFQMLGNESSVFGLENKISRRCPRQGGRDPGNGMKLRSPVPGLKDYFNG